MLHCGWWLALHALIQRLQIVNYTHVPNVASKEQVSIGRDLDSEGSEEVTGHFEVALNF